MPREVLARGADRASSLSLRGGESDSPHEEIEPFLAVYVFQRAHDIEQRGIGNVIHMESGARLRHPRGDTEEAEKALRTGAPATSHPLGILPLRLGDRRKNITPIKG